MRALILAARNAAADVRSREGSSALGQAVLSPSPHVITGYEILGELHRGGQGVVYRGLQKSTNRTVAIKVMKEGPFAGEASRLRFEREVNILAQLDHRCIIGIIDRGVSAGSHFLVMDYVDGCPLDRFARDRRLDLPARLRLFAAVCDAVSAAHQRGVIHRDLKPGNILVNNSGEPRILDFGLAKIANDDGAATQTGQFLGSLPWASPEQFVGQHSQTDTRSDVYSLGIILYQLLTDRFPYSTAGDLHHVLSAIRDSDPPPPSSLSPNVDDDLDAITLKCLRKEPPQRYQSVGELSRDVQHYLNGEPIEAKRDSRWYLLRRMLSRHRVAAAVSAAFVILTTASAVALSILYARSRSLLSDLQSSSARIVTESSKSRKVAEFAQGMLSGIDPVSAGTLDTRLLRRILDDAAKRLDAELAGEPEVEASLRFTIGKAYQATGEYTTAAANFERAVQLRRHALGPAHLDTLAAIDALAMLYWENDQLAEAEPLCRSVLDARQSVQGADHPDRLTTLSILAEILEKQGKHREAEALARESLERRSRTLGPDDPETLSSLNNLAGILMSQQRFDEAEPLYTGAIEAETRIKGPLHPDTLRTRGNLATLYQQNGKNAESESLHREILALRRQVLGEDHPDTVRCLGNLAILLRDKGEFDEAEQLIRKVVESTRRTSGDKHPSLSGHLMTLSSLLGKKGDFVQAEKLLHEAIAIDEISLPPDHFQRISRKLGLGACLAKMGRFEESEQLLLAGHNAIKERADIPDDWKLIPVRYCVMLYQAWDAAAPGTGKAEKAAEWQAKLPTTNPAN